MIDWNEIDKIITKVFNCDEKFMDFDNLNDKEKLACCIARDCYRDEEGGVYIGGSNDACFTDEKGQAMYFDDEKYLRELPFIIDGREFYDNKS